MDVPCFFPSTNNLKQSHPLAARRVSLMDPGLPSGVFLSSIASIFGGTSATKTGDLVMRKMYLTICEISET